MKKLITMLILTIFLAGGTLAGLSQAGAAPAASPAGTHLENLPREPLSDAEKKGLLLMREEEKLARDLYKALYEKWGIRAFSNIAKSEQQHMDSVKALLDRYGLPDPAGSNKPGEFSNPALQKTYDDLLKKGLASRAGAVTVGAMVEELDIKDLREEKRKADNKDILMVYENLEKGSRNHLRAFGKQLSKENVRYKASYLTQAEVEKIMKSPQERG